MRSLRIIVDVDNTIGDLTQAWLNKLNQDHGYKVRPSDIVSYNVCLAYPELLREEVYAPLFAKGFWKTVEPVYGAVENLEKLNDEHSVYLCSASNYKTIERKYEDFIQRCFPFIDWSQVIICDDKWLVRGDVIIDDYPLNLIGADKTTHKFLYDQPYNRAGRADENELRGLTRVYGWNEIYAKVCDLSKDSG